MKKLLIMGSILVLPAILSAEPPSASAIRAKASAAQGNGAATRISRPANVERRSVQNGNRPNVNRPGNNGNRPNVNRPGNNGNRPNVNRPGNNGNRPGHNGNNTVIINNNHHNNNWGGPRVRGGYYRYPHGYAYHRHGIGYVMPRVFLTTAYFYTAYAALNLAAPDPGYSWVRYGPDLLLVDTRTGSVRDVRYGVFDE